MKTAVLFLVFAVLHLGQPQPCPEAWEYFQGICYGYGETAVTWSSAQAICQAQGAKLTDATSLEVNEFIKSIVREKSPYWVWLDGSDIFHEGVWKWTHRQTEFSNFTNWATGEPNNSHNDEDCLMMFKPVDYKWNDQSCNTLCNFICAVPARCSFDNV